jgi:hypothetical protein
VPFDGHLLGIVLGPLPGTDDLLGWALQSLHPFSDWPPPSVCTQSVGFASTSTRSREERRDGRAWVLKSSGGKEEKVIYMVSLSSPYKRLFFFF